MPHAGIKALVVGLLASTAVASCALLPTAPTDLAIETVGNRADLISGGDVLLRIRLPAGARGSDATFAIDGKRVDELASGGIEIGDPDPTRDMPFARSPDGNGLLARIGGLREGDTDFALTYGGRTVHLTVTNHPNGGPLFSGPQIQPWTCREGAIDAQCNRPTTYTYSYMPKAGGKFAPYDPAKPATDVAMTTTSDGVTVPYIVRTESFSQNRSGVSVAILFDPAIPWMPELPHPQWNRGVYVLQGAGCGTGFTEEPAGDPLNDRALKQGFAVVTVALLHNTINCNPVVQAEAAMMAKEHVAETYGPFDFVFAQGSSGGAISQLMDQNLYPGLYDGLILNHLFADSDASRANAYDCSMVTQAWSKSATPWTDAQKSAVAGMLSGCASSPTRFQIYNPAVGTGCNAPDAMKFDTVKNPKGVRCTLQDYEINQVGRRPDGYAPGRMDTVGVQFGLKALMSGAITPVQFVDLNAAIDGHDINFNEIPTRTEADRSGLPNLYRSGLNNTLNNLASTPIIETRLSVTDFHQPFHAVMVRARLDRAQGSHENYALWRTPGAREAAMDASFDVMVAWIKAIKADARNVPQAQKVLDNRPPLAKDRCIVEGADAPAAACPRPPELVRVLAGAPDTNDIGKCQLKPLRASDYGAITFTPAQWASLQQRFPSGVCDYAKPFVDFRMAEPWLRYTGEGKAEPMGAAPASR